MDTQYHLPQGSSPLFDVRYDDDGRMVSLMHPDDATHVNWAANSLPGDPWGTCSTTLHVTRANGTGITAEVTREFTDRGTLREAYTFTNATNHDVYAANGQIGVTVVLPDYYADAATSLERCAHAHICCAGASSWIMALNMGGGTHNLGLVLTEGSIVGYDAQRDTKTIKADRGRFRLLPEPLHLHPGESYTLAWELLWFRDRQDFLARLDDFDGFTRVHADRFVLFSGEAVRFEAHVGGRTEERTVSVTRADKPVLFRYADGIISVEERPEADEPTGERRYDITVDGRTTSAVFRIIPPLDTLTARRCHFIAERQQCHDPFSELDGAYLVYDNETGSQYYGHWNDHNGGRERLGMGATLALYLQTHPDPELEASLEQYEAYVMRELFDAETGEVFNDAGRDNSYRRLYNYPWMGSLLLELHRLRKDRRYLDWYCRCKERYYAEGGARFYAIGVQIEESIALLQRAGMDGQAERMLELYREHAERIIANGRNYPAHEVSYEQSIVGPATVILGEMAAVTGEQRYADHFREHLAILDLFNGCQPHYRLNEVALRHWDDYWFGKRQLPGDTLPHYWSSITGHAFALTGDKDYERRATANLRASLTMIHDDGSATCAHVFPALINGQPADFDDPWANDQDWALYYALKHTDILSEG